MTLHPASTGMQHTRDHRGESWHLSLPSGEAVRLAWSYKAGTWRGLHAAGVVKRVHLLRGRFFGVLFQPNAALSRYNPESFESDDGISLDHEGHTIIPAHWYWGWLALTDDTVVAYHFDSPLGPERVLRWNDPILKDIPWPVRPTILSDRDRDAPNWSAVDAP